MSAAHRPLTSEKSLGSPRGTSIDVVAGNQFDRSRSGVARFNWILAEKLGVPVLAVDDGRLAGAVCPLLSVKFGELREGEGQALLDQLSSREPEAPFRMFLHDVTDLPIERELVARAQVVYAGNEELAERVRPLSPRVETLWSPATVLDERRFEPASISVFSFGMAHKLRTDMYRRLHDLLDATRASYALYVSNANHESIALGDAQVVYEEMHAVFPQSLYFLGHLSDVAVSNFIDNTTFFAAFFPGGARANNSTVVAAMNRGAVVLTNLDEYSPGYLRHLDTVIDVNRCDELPLDPVEHDRMATAAQEAARELSWERFAQHFLEP